MTNPSVIPQSQHALIDGLLARQDNVIRELDLLEQKLLEAIDAIRLSKKQVEDPASDVDADDSAKLVVKKVA